MDRQLKVGIAGFGLVGARRREFIDQHPNLKVVAVCDVRFQRQKEVKDGLVYYKSYNDLLSHGFDILFVCMPNDVAPMLTILGLQKGLHVFCEKPPGRTVGDIKRVRAEEEIRPNLKLKYGFNHRYHESVREAVSIVESRELGRLINIRGVYGKSAFNPWPRETKGESLFWRTDRAIAGGGILLDQGIHMVDLMRLFAGEFYEVKSFVRNTFWNLDVEDNAYALMASEEGVIAMLHSTATQWRHRFKLELSLERGAVILSGILSGSKSYGQESLKVVFREDDDAGNPRERATTYIRDPSWREEIFEFADCILNDNPVQIGNSLDALRTMELVYRVYCSDPEWRVKYELSMD